MSLTENERQIVVGLELEKADKTFQEFEYVWEKGLFSVAANRLYYTLFHAVSALLISDGHSVKSHRGIMVLFGQYYVKTAVFSKEDGSLLSDLVIMRDNADYNCLFEANEEKLSPFIEPTRQFIDRIKKYIANK